jgi:hypothetical protein
MKSLAISTRKWLIELIVIPKSLFQAVHQRAHMPHSGLVFEKWQKILYLIDKAVLLSLTN